MATTFSDLKTRLNTWLRDTANRTFTDAEKTEVLTEAVNDPYVYNAVRDTSLTLLANTYSYTAPTGVSAVFELGIDIDGNGIFHALPTESWDFMNGVIYITDMCLPTGRAIQVVGKSKLTTSTSDFPAEVQEYILHLAMAGAFEMLKTSLTTRFLKNDMTMAEVIQSANTHKQRAAELRQSIANQRLTVI